MNGGQTGRTTKWMMERLEAMSNQLRLARALLLVSSRLEYYFSDLEC